LELQRNTATNWVLSANATEMFNKD